VILGCYPSGLLAIANYVRERGRRPDIRVAWSTGETMYSEWRHLISEQLRCPVADCYGAAETGHIAHTCGGCGAMHVNDETTLVEIEEGTSEILLTDLTNRATPLIRYRIGDRGALADEDAPCGRGLSSLLWLEGRTSDVIDLGDGNSLGGMLLPAIMLGYPDVRGYQLWHSAGPRVQFLIQTPGDQHIAEIDERLRRVVPAEIEYIAVDDIPPTETGKRPVIVQGREYTGPGRVLHPSAPGVL
jgi:phenylacetate-CoA ligase